MKQKISNDEAITLASRELKASSKNLKTAQTNLIKAEAAMATAKKRAEDAQAEHAKNTLAFRAASEAVLQDAKVAPLGS